MWALIVTRMCYISICNRGLLCQCKFIIWMCCISVTFNQDLWRFVRISTTRDYCVTIPHYLLYNYEIPSGLVIWIWHFIECRMSQCFTRTCYVQSHCDFSQVSSSLSIYFFNRFVASVLILRHDLLCHKYFHDQDL